MATAIPESNTWNAYPFPSSILLYKEGEGYPDFDVAKAKTYFKKVNDKVARLIEETIAKWNMAGL
jgi:creatinine amidohydrolase